MDPMCTAKPPNPHSGSPKSKPSCSADAPEKHGFEILNACFDAAFSRYPQLIAMGEDIGRWATSIRDSRGCKRNTANSVSWIPESGKRRSWDRPSALALRGFRPIADIQYLDYILYALETMSDDLATLALAYLRRAEGARHHPNARPPAGRNLAFRISHGGNSQPARGNLYLRPTGCHAGGGFLQHDPAIR